jgi:5'-3' exonuclease
VVASYVEGLHWVLQYYHSGCQSWNWFYPYLYAPLASDLRNLSEKHVTFNQGKPFTPLLQLLSVLPPQSGSFLPPAYQRLMESPDSRILDLYPQDFLVDANGKKNAWECVVCIPFIEEEVLVGAVNEIDHLKELTVSERLRNLPGIVRRYQPRSNGGSMVGTFHINSNNGEDNHSSRDSCGGTGDSMGGSASARIGVKGGSVKIDNKPTQRVDLKDDGAWGNVLRK